MTSLTQRHHDTQRPSTLALWAALEAERDTAQTPKILADLELLLRSMRRYTALMSAYNPLYGMSEEERIRATARTVGLEVPVDSPSS